MESKEEIAKTFSRLEDEYFATQEEMCRLGGALQYIKEDTEPEIRNLISMEILKYNTKCNDIREEILKYEPDWNGVAAMYARL